MTGHWWLDWLIGIAGGLVLAWLILVIALAVVGHGAACCVRRCGYCPT